MKHSCRAGPLFSGIQASLSIIFKHRMNVFYLLSIRFSRADGERRQNSSRKALNIALNDFLRADGLSCQLTVAQPFFLIRQFLVEVDCKQQKTFAPPLRPVSPLSSRCILGISRRWAGINFCLTGRRTQEGGDEEEKRSGMRRACRYQQLSLSQETEAGLCWFHINNNKKKEFLFIKHDAAILDCFHNVSLDQRFFGGFQFHSLILFWSDEVQSEPRVRWLSVRHDRTRSCFQIFAGPKSFAAAAAAAKQTAAEQTRPQGQRLSST